MLRRIGLGVVLAATMASSTFAIIVFSVLATTLRDEFSVARWQIDVDVFDGRRVVAEVSEHLRPAAALTCKAVERPTHSRVPVFEGLTVRA